MNVSEGILAYKEGIITKEELRNLMALLIELSFNRKNILGKEIRDNG